MFSALYGEIMALLTEFNQILENIKLIKAFFLHIIISLSNELFYFECL